MNTPEKKNVSKRPTYKDVWNLKKTIEHSKKYSSSDIYHLIWLNNHITGVKISEDTCKRLLSLTNAWNELPSRIQNQIERNILDFMICFDLPLQNELETIIFDHPIVIDYFKGTLPPRNSNEIYSEQKEKLERQSQIDALRDRTRNEMSFVLRNSYNSTSWNEETPTDKKENCLKLKPYSDSFLKSFFNDEDE